MGQCVNCSHSDHFQFPCFDETCLCGMPPCAGCGRIEKGTWGLATGVVMDDCGHPPYVYPISVHTTCGYADLAIIIV